jgi:Skp family chaperone for outer membrane proteins
VKKMILFVGGFAAMLAGVVAGSSYLFANGPAAVQPVQQQGTKIAVVNIGKVFNEYTRAKAFKEDLERTLKPYNDKAKTLTDQITAWENALKSGTVKEAEKENYIQAIRKSRRDLEDMGAEIQKNLGTKQEQNLVTLYKEVDVGIATIAKAQGYQIVLGYGDPVEKDLLLLFPNINRKMQAMDLGSTVPLYVDPANDLSAIVVYNLNRWVAPKDGVIPTGGQK